jgi:hypothetical protein
MKLARRSWFLANSSPVRYWDGGLPGCSSGIGPNTVSSSGMGWLAIANPRSLKEAGRVT